jgi:hypothetical protein
MHCHTRRRRSTVDGMMRVRLSSNLARVTPAGRPTLPMPGQQLAEGDG